MDVDENERKRLRLTPEEETVFNLIEQVKTGQADVSTLNRLPGEQYGALRSCIQFKCKRLLVEALLETKADPNFYDGYNTPLGNAQDKEAISLLLGYGADPQKCNESTLSLPLTHYLLKNKKQRGKPHRNEAFDTMTLLLQNGESIDRYGDADKHLLYEVINTFLISKEEKKEFLSFLIGRGSNPNEHYLKSSMRDRLLGKQFQESVYETLEYTGEGELAQFIRKERGWYFMKPLFLALHKDQDANCFISRLPHELITFIGKIALNHKDVVIG